MKNYFINQTEHKMSEFHKYSSIKNTYNSKFLQTAACTVPSSEEWVGCEKVHGANYSYIFGDGIDPFEAKRSGPIKSTENFYGSKDMCNRYKDRFNIVYELVKKKYGGDVIQLFGELYGKNVQKGVYYCDTVEFIGFDIRVDQMYIPYDDMISIYKEAGIRCSEPVITGSLETVLQFDVNNFNSTIPENFGETNIAEGIVIRPRSKDYYLNSGQRVILKKKSTKFSEKGGQKIVSIFSTDPKITKLVDQISDYLVEQRVHSVLSKVGEDVNINKIIGLLIQDALSEYTEEFGFVLDSLDKKDRTKLMNCLRYKARKIVEMSI